MHLDSIDQMFTRPESSVSCAKAELRTDDQGGKPVHFAADRLGKVNEVSMNFDPQKFFIGLMDLFSILLPGALLTYLLMGGVGPVVLGDHNANLVGAQAWAAFLFEGYIL
jgi:hypothetical protein